jgi:hypothetical protein
MTQFITHNTSIVFVAGPVAEPLTAAVPAAAAGPDRAAVAPAGRAVASTGVDACDAFLGRTMRCGGALTHDPEALAHFLVALRAARGEHQRVATGGDERAKAELAERCEAALRAYDEAPCTP